MTSTHKQYVEVASLAGRIMLESHAETYRVEDTVLRILSLSGLSNPQVNSTTTALYISLDDQEETFTPITVLIRIKERGNHLGKIYQVNHISRLLTSGKIDLNQAKAKLTFLDESNYTTYSKDLAIILMVLFFTLLLGGSAIDLVFSLLAGSLITLTKLGKNRFGMNDFMAGAFATTLTAFSVTGLANFFNLPVSTDVVIISALMPLYPGTALMNGIRDTLKGDYSSGIARITDALVIAISLALGVALGLFLAQGV